MYKHLKFKDLRILVCCATYEGMVLESFDIILNIINSKNYVLFFRRADDSSKRQIRQTPDWSEYAVAGDHLWIPTSVSGDFCYVGDSECTVSLKMVQSYFFFHKHKMRITFTI